MSHFDADRGPVGPAVTIGTSGGEAIETGNIYTLRHWWSTSSRRDGTLGEGEAPYASLSSCTAGKK